MLLSILDSLLNIPSYPQYPTTDYDLNEFLEDCDEEEEWELEDEEDED